MEFRVYCDTTFIMLYNYLKAKFKSVELYESLEASEAESDFALTIEYCENQIHATLVIIINHNRELVLVTNIIDKELVMIYTNTIDASKIASNAINAIIGEETIEGMCLPF